MTILDVVRVVLVEIDVDGIIKRTGPNKTIEPVGKGEVELAAQAHHRGREVVLVVVQVTVVAIHRVKARCIDKALVGRRITAGRHAVIGFAKPLLPWNIRLADDAVVAILHSHVRAQRELMRAIHADAKQVEILRIGSRRREQHQRSDQPAPLLYRCHDDVFLLNPSAAFVLRDGVLSVGHHSFNRH